MREFSEAQEVREGLAALVLRSPTNGANAKEPVDRYIFINNGDLDMLPEPTDVISTPPDNGWNMRREKHQGDCFEDFAPEA